jgi:hypothetical protein
MQKKVYQILLRNFLKAKSLIFKRSFISETHATKKLDALKEGKITFESLVLEDDCINLNDPQNRSLMSFERDTAGSK